MAQPSMSSSQVIVHSVYAAGTSNFPGSRNSAATILPDAGVIYAAASVRAPVGAFTSVKTGAITGTSLISTGAIQGTTITGTTGFVFTNSVVKKFACGTIITTGGATAPITSTGLTTITHIFMMQNKSAYSNATTGLALARPCVAAGTPGSFYPIAFKYGTIAGGGPVLGTVSATWRYEALGA